MAGGGPLNLTTSTPTCPPGYHWEAPTGPVQGIGALSDLRERMLAGCVANHKIVLHLPPPPPPPPAPVQRTITLHVGPAPAPVVPPAPAVVTRPPVGTGLTAPPPPPPARVETPDMATLDAPALPSGDECPSGLTWRGVGAAAGGAFFLGMLVGAVSFGGLGRAKPKRGRR